MHEPEEMSTLLATMPDGSSVQSVMIDGSPPGHLYRVVGSDGTILDECPALRQLTHYLAKYDANKRRAT
jgi:hypothetical protein